MKIENIGEIKTAAPFDIAIYISEDVLLGNEDDFRVGDTAILNPVGVGETVTVPVTISAVQPAGVYHWAAIVDDGGFIEESKENNNRQIGPSFTVVAQPSDLLVSGAPAGPQLVVRNSFYDVDLELRNIAAGETTGAFQVSVYLSENQTAGDEEDVRIGNFTVTDILQSDTRHSVTVQVTIPSDQPPGNYYYAAIVDATRFETEIREDNNGAVSTATVLVAVTEADLVVLTDPRGPSEILREGRYEVTGEIQNFSNGPVLDSFTIAAVVTSDDEVGNADDVNLGEVVIEGGLEAGEIVLVSVPVTIPVGQALGSFRWGLSIDTGGAIDEADELNNARLGLPVTALPFPPDLVVDGVLQGPEEVSRGRLYSVPVNIQNIGLGSTISDFNVAVYVSANESVGDADDIFVGVTTVTETLVPDATTNVDVSVIIPTSTSPSNLRWVVLLNPEGLIVEADRTNNSLLGNALAFPVIELPETLSFGSVTIGQSRTQVIEIRNDGSLPITFDIESLTNGVTVNPTQVLDLLPGDLRTVALTYAPTSEGILGGQIHITSEIEGEQIIELGGTGVRVNRDRVRFDFDPGGGVQDVLTQRTGVNQNASIEVHVSDLPEVTEVSVQIQFDPDQLVFATNGWMAGAFALGDAFVQAEIVSPGLLEVRVSSQSGRLGINFGHLGTVTFRTLGGFYDPSGESQAIVEAVQVRYITLAGEEMAFNVAAAVALDLACWADVDGDGIVAFNDFRIFADSFGVSENAAGWNTGEFPHRRMDGNGDGKVDYGDFLLLANVFGSRCE